MKPIEERRRLYVAVRDCWRQYKPFRALEVPTSAMYFYLRLEFVEGKEPNLSTNRENQYWDAITNHCVTVMIAFITPMFPQKELKIKYLPGYDARLRVGTCEGNLFLLPQSVDEFVCCIKIQD